jgi:hypothetical protein
VWPAFRDRSPAGPRISFAPASRSRQSLQLRCCCDRRSPRQQRQRSRPTFAPAHPERPGRSWPCPASRRITLARPAPAARGLAGLLLWRRSCCHLLPRTPTSPHCPRTPIAPLHLTAQERSSATRSRHARGCSARVSAISSQERRNRPQRLKSRWGKVGRKAQSGPIKADRETAFSPKRLRGGQDLCARGGVLTVAPALSRQALN